MIWDLFNKSGFRVSDTWNMDDLYDSAALGNDGISSLDQPRSSEPDGSYMKSFTTSSLPNTQIFMNQNGDIHADNNGRTYYSFYKKIILSRVEWLVRRGLDWMIGFIAPYTFTTRDYKQLQSYRYSIQFTVHRHTIFTSRMMAMDL
jgi:hypothetical protein